MVKIHLWPEEAHEQEGTVSAGFTLEDVNGDRKPVWYRLPPEYASTITNWCDPYALAVLFKAMVTPADLMLHGKVSPSLLFNLKEFQSAWASWLPDRYTAIEIIAEKEEERTIPNHKRAILTFSGGADSCYTTWHYANPMNERLPYSLSAGIFIHGYDIPPNLQNTSERAFEKARMLLNSLGMTLIPLTTNLRSLKQPAVDAGGASLASCLMLLQEEYVAGLIASCDYYAYPFFPFGSNPLTDRMMSSKTFQIRNDGAKVSRIEKLKAISEWPEAMQYLRVCVGRIPSERDKNCCRCEKCVRTILEFRALGRSRIPSFENDVTNWQIFKLKYGYMSLVRHYYEDIITTAKINQVTGLWIWILKFSMVVNKLRIKVEQFSWINHLIHRGKKIVRHMVDLHSMRQRSSS